MAIGAFVLVSGSVCAYLYHKLRVFERALQLFEGALALELAAARSGEDGARAVARHARALSGAPASHVCVVLLDEPYDEARGGLVVRAAGAPAPELLPTFLALPGGGAPSQLLDGGGLAPLRVPLRAAGGGEAPVALLCALAVPSVRPLLEAAARAPCVQRFAYALRSAEAPGAGAAGAAAAASAPPPTEGSLRSWAWNVFGEGDLCSAAAQWEVAGAAALRRARAPLLASLPAAARLPAGFRAPTEAEQAALDAAVAANSPEGAPPPPAARACDRAPRPQPPPGEARLLAAAAAMLAPRLSQAGVAPAVGAAFLSAMRTSYTAAPFHNWFHAVAVLHGAWLLLGVPALARALPAGAQLALLLAAVGHDAGHPGHSSSLAAALRTPAYERFGRRGDGLLERLHAATLAEALEESGVARALPAALLPAVEGAVLHTDMGTHGATVAALEAWADEGGGGGGDGAPLPTHRVALLLGAALHAADLGGLCYAAPVAAAWTARVTAEFRAQAAAEEALGLPVTPHMAGLMDDAACARAQVRFIEGTVAPLWGALKRVVDGPLGGGGGLEQPTENLRAALAHFKLRAAKDAVK